MRRAALYAGVALAAVAALRLPPPTPRVPGERLRDGGTRRWSRSDTLDRGESLSSLLGRGGLSGHEARSALESASSLMDDRRVPAGLRVEMLGDSADPRPREIRFRIDADRVLRLLRSGDAWSAAEERIAWTTDTVVVHGAVRSTLYDALSAGSQQHLPRDARAELAWEVADVYEYRVDMSRELQAGDSVRVVFERARSEHGDARIGAVLVAGLERAGREMQAIRFTDGTGKAGYYDGEGKSMKGGFLRAPLSFRRISSVFGMRRHPILGVWRRHAGTDYAAAAGTPVRSIGDGTVVFAGRRGGYGNTIEVRHPNGYVSRYGHLRGFARGVRSGTRVAMGETVGYVGATGLATAPHLHFEVLVNGQQRNPAIALRSTGGAPLAGGDLARFMDVRQQALARLDAPPGVLR